MKRTIIVALCAVIFTALAHADTLTLATIPASGDVAGEPGTAVGWGFILTDSSSTDWIELNDSYVSGSLDTGIYGTYVDYLTLTNAPLYVAGPAPESPTVNQPWVPSATPPLGLGEFDLYITAPPGLTLSDDINVDYTLFTQDPNSPTFDPSASFDGTGTFSVAVQVQSTPEPASMTLVGGALLPLLLAIRRRRRGGLIPPSQP